MSVATLTNLFVPTCPTWCIECRVPDPGVVYHYSRPWKGADILEGATWEVQVTQRVTATTGEGLAVVEVTGAEGAYGSTAELARALLSAEALKNHINTGRVS